tara:strand:- start:28405 stop:29532 length:1128 start_codon:yes stop_codon:yes gene_type:complete
MTTSTESNTAVIAEDLNLTPTQTNILIGFDLGTNTSCVIASKEGNSEIFFKKAVPTVVGYAKESILPGILPEDKQVFFGNDALKHRAHLDLVYPLKDGIIHDIKAAKDFVHYIRTHLCAEDPNASIKAAIGIPANTTVTAREDLRETVAGVFEEVILVPEPFLAALGCRNENRLQDPDYLDPVRSSLFIDIGAGTADLCIIQGYYPTADDLVSIPFAGDAIDEVLSEKIRAQYPEATLSPLQVRTIKEQYSYVGAPKQGMEIKVLISGKPRTLEIGPLIGEACNTLLEKIAKATIELINRCPADSVEDILQNIIMTGGGSQIQGIATELQRLLAREGYQAPTVNTVGEHYKAFVGLGAWKAGQSAKANQWQRLLR